MSRYRHGFKPRLAPVIQARLLARLLTVPLGDAGPLPEPDAPIVCPRCVGLGRGRGLAGEVPHGRSRPPGDLSHGQLESGACCLCGGTRAVPFRRALAAIARINEPLDGCAACRALRSVDRLGGGRVK